MCGLIKVGAATKGEIKSKGSSRERATRAVPNAEKPESDERQRFTSAVARVSVTFESSERGAGSISVLVSLSVCHTPRVQGQDAVLLCNATRKLYNARALALCYD